MSDEKKVRGAVKAKVTKVINNIKRYIAEEDPGQVKSNLQTLCDKFKEFEVSNEAVEATLENEVDIEANDSYFYAVQDEYIATLNSAKKYLQTMHALDVAKDVKGPEPDKPSADVLSQSDIFGMMNLPRIELEVFDGNPMHFHSFMTMFDEVVDKTATDDRVKMTRLMQYTSGKAKEAIRYCTLMEGGKGYLQARDILQKRFGNKYLVTERIVRSLRQGRPIKGPEELCQLSDDLSCCHLTLSQMDTLQELECQSAIVDIVNRLQPYLQIAWKKKALNIKCSSGHYPKFVDFVDFVQREAENANDPVYGKLGQRSKSVGNNDSKSKSSNSTLKSSAAFSASVTKPNVQWQRPPCVMCKSDHKLLYCQSFKRMKPVDRLDLVEKHKLCKMCLLNNHTTDECRKLTTCGIDGCNEKHTKFLHVSKCVNNAESNETADKQSHCIEVTSANITASPCTDVHMPIVAVSVNGYDTCALLDTASSSSFCTQSLVSELGIQGNTIDYVLNTLGTSGEMKSKVVSLRLSSTDGTNTLYLPYVYVVDSIPVKHLNVDVHTYPYLKDLPLVDADSRPQILIGQDNAEALLPLEVRKGIKGQPFAVRTLFGWSVNGPAKLGPPVKRSVVSNFISASSIDVQLQSILDLENEGLAGEEYCMSRNEKRVVDLWDKECRKSNDHYEIPIPWKPGVQLPNNLVMASSRLKSLKASLGKRGLTSIYDGEIQKLLTNGYAECVPLEVEPKLGHVWYLPHHAVITDKKPGKVRIVFDCAAKFQGESLNQNCYQGPDFNNKLLDVLLRFRQHPVAMMSDVEAMYNQVVVPVEDRDCLRFLWYDNQGNVVHYRMTRHLFGGVWCSSIATYALRRAVTDCLNPSPQVVDVVFKSFYVDDCLQSMVKADEAVSAIHETKKVLAGAGFRLTKFVTNDVHVMESIPKCDLSKEMETNCPDSQSKALGVKWNVSRDTFCFDVKVDFVSDLTRRKMLSTIASLFDPLGLVSPIVITGKQLFQEATKMQLSWDAPIPESLKNRWKVWIGDVERLMTVEVSRCIRPKGYEDAAIELHHFSDASLKSYGCCTYVRCIAKDGHINVTLLLSKSKVAPLKRVTIPRLELQAAVLSAKVDHMLRHQLDIDFAPSYFWVDSELVLKYICNEDRKFHVFVGNRVSAICELTDPNQWHHIAGHANPADVVSRGQSMNTWRIDDWVKGPKFLWTYKNTWEIAQVDRILPVDDPEVKVSKVKSDVCLSVSVVEDSLLKLFQHYSNWYRLKRAVAWLLRLKRLLRGDKSILGVQLSVDEIKDSEISIIRCAQWQSFTKELQCLSSGHVVRKSSPVKPLDPFLDQNDLLRVGGRLKRSYLEDNQKHPYIVSHKHPIALLIARQYHQVAHTGTEWVVNEIRKMYWITKIRHVVKRVARECVSCKKLFADPCVQKMASLPPERLEAGKPPFSYVGIDCFGPLLVKQGRAEVKRYGCVFTCLNTRAIHLEKLNSLDTDSFLNGFRRFVCRRGHVAKVWSDNGTNFVGGKAELSKSMSDLDQDKIQSYAVCKNIVWHFNPPHASHMGGIWERMIRTIRKVLLGICSLTHKLTDESLETLFCEVEFIVNSRPITKVSDDVNDPHALSPNHLLLLREQPSLSPGTFSDTDLYKRRWRCVQHLANAFWRRWLHEYLPLLQARTKWFTESRNVKVGDLVLIKDENTPRGIWPMGVIQEVYPSSDKLVRSVKVRTKASCLVRPISKVVLLEGSSV